MNIARSCFLKKREETQSEIKEGLQHLQAIGALSSSNTIPIENIIESIDEIEISHEVSSTEDIIKEYSIAHKESKVEAEEDPVEIEPAPTPQDITKTISTLFRYIETKDCDEADGCDAHLHKLERYINKEIFDSYSKQTDITDYLQKPQK